MKGIRGSEPDGTTSDCFWVLLMYGGEMTANELQERVARENEPFGWPVPDLAQVKGALQCLANRTPRLAEPATPGRRGRRGSPGVWRITDHGYAMSRVWVPDDGPAQ